MEGPPWEQLVRLRVDVVPNPDTIPIACHALRGRLAGSSCVVAKGGLTPLVLGHAATRPYGVREE